MVMLKKAVERILAAAVAVLIGSIVFIEVRHHSMYGHWFGYGWHVDVLSDQLEDPLPGIHHALYVGVTNFGLLPGSVEGCIPKDPRGRQIPVSAHHIETQEKSGWEIVHDGWPFRCNDGRIVRRTVWPLMSFYTVPTFAAYVGRKGDWVRLVAESSFGTLHGREFASMPFQLSEGAPKHCPKECVTIRSLNLCEPLSAEKSHDDLGGSCKKLEAWRDRPGSTHPATVDVVLEIQNTADEVTASGDFIGLTTMDSLIAPTHSYGLADLDKMRTTVGWGREDDVRMIVIKSLKAGETRSVRISGLDIRKITETFADDPSSLWPWWIRVNVRIEDGDGDRVATGNVSLPLIPSDNRLAEKSQEPVNDLDGVHRIIIAPRPRKFW